MRLENRPRPQGISVAFKVTVHHKQPQAAIAQSPEEPIVGHTHMPNKAEDGLPRLLHSTDKSLQTQKSILGLPRLVKVL